MHCRAAGRLLDTVLKSATIGLCLRGGLHAVSVLLSQLSKQKRRAKRSGEHLEALALDTLKFMAFLAAFGGTYVTVDEGLCYCLGRERCTKHPPYTFCPLSRPSSRSPLVPLYRTKRWRAAVAGGCPAPTVLLVG